MAYRHHGRGRRAIIRAALSALALFTASGITAGLAGGCSGTDATSGKKVVLHTKVVADPEIKGSFNTDVGWTVTLSKAAISVGALYYFDGEPAFVRLEPAPRRPDLERFFGVSAAYAHPGHYQAGNAVGQMLVGSSFDLFGATGALAEGEGTSGPFRSARFQLGKDVKGPAAAALDGHVAVAEGMAVKTGASPATPIYFRVSADFADVAKSVTNGEVDGCAFEPAADVEDNGTVTVSIKPSIWFDLVDFTKVAPGTADAPTEIPHGDIAQVGFALGLVQLTAYTFAFTKDPVSP